jgi:hypothetical protein
MQTSQFFTPNEELTEPGYATTFKRDRALIYQKPRAVTYKVCTAKLERGYPVNVESWTVLISRKRFQKKSETYK